ncbi:hypothetical protein HQ576_16940 [bacterium]|nr:hypothetical protein [bacterium]
MHLKWDRALAQPPAAKLLDGKKELWHILDSIPHQDDGEADLCPGLHVVLALRRRFENEGVGCVGVTPHDRV